MLPINNTISDAPRILHLNFIVFLCCCLLGRIILIKNYNNIRTSILIIVCKPSFAKGFFPALRFQCSMVRSYYLYTIFFYLLLLTPVQRSPPIPSSPKKRWHDDLGNHAGDWQALALDRNNISKKI